MKKYTPENAVFSDEFNIIERADLVNAQNHNASVMQMMVNEVALKKQLDECLGSMEGDKPQFAEGLEADNVIDAINQVFQVGNEKKEKLVENLVAVGVQASTSDTWEQLLDKVLAVTDTSKDTVTANVLLDGYTAHDSNGDLITGAMVDNAGVTVDAGNTTQDSTYAYLSIPQDGHYDQGSKVRTAKSNFQKTIPISCDFYAHHANSGYLTIDLNLVANGVTIASNSVWVHIEMANKNQTGSGSIQGACSI